ncbi:FtsX-like permease family protein [Pontibacter sp. G13]|uniref:ABC transporter permease n=1 Tax=Pontibacter sp. G13 TaxID=3074898 RepID=UPI00288C3C16|nr:FtsX-like permease family protein [Pontibacter sp. G13]WNJ18601.1 FtsX-like permease family protein [Pontibacter sp. G13]
MYLILAWRNIWRNKRRTFITAGMIAMAVLLSIIMESFQAGIFNKMVDNMTNFYSGNLQIHQAGYWDNQVIDESYQADPTLLSSIQDHPKVLAKAPRLENFALISTGLLTRGCLTVGIDPSSEASATNLPSRIREGEYLSLGEPGVMIGEELAKRLKVSVGDTLIFIAQGYHGVQSDGKFPLVGILDFGSPDLNLQMAYLPLDIAQDMYDAFGRQTAEVIITDGSQGLETLRDELQETIGSEYEVMTWADMMPELVQFVEGKKGGAKLGAGILYMIIFFGMFGTLLMMATERKYEFGVMAAIGMKRSRIAGVLIIETLCVAVLGALIGCALAFPVVWYFQVNPVYMGAEMAEVYADFGLEPYLPAEVDFNIFWSQVKVILTLTLLVSIYPFASLIKLDPVKAMRK